VYVGAVELYMLPAYQTSL